MTTMLMIILMTILSIELIAYSTEKVHNDTGHPPPHNGHGFPYKTHIERFDTSIGGRTSNAKLPSTAPTASPTFRTNITSRVTIRFAGDNTSAVTDLADHPFTVNSRHAMMERAKDNETLHSTKHSTNIVRDLTPNSNVQLIQLYAQPLTASPITGHDLSIQSTLSPYMYGVFAPLTNPIAAVGQSHVYIAAPLTTYKSLPYESLNSGELFHKSSVHKPFQYYVNDGVAATERTAATFRVPPPPSVDVYNRNQRYRPVRMQHQYVVVAPNVAPLRAPSPVTVVPPVSVARIYKYTERREGGIKLPFIRQTDSLDDNLTLLSATFKDRLVHDGGITRFGIRNYLRPSTVLGQPSIYYKSPATVLAHDYHRNDEFRSMNKFNEDPRTGGHRQSGRRQRTKKADKKESKKDDDEAKTVDAQAGKRKERKYTEEDVKKVLMYIDHLKRTNRGRKRYHDNDDERAERMNKKRPSDSGDDGEQLELETVRETKKRKKQKNEFNFDAEEDFQSTSFSDDDRNQEESRRKFVKANKDETLKSGERQIIPHVNEDENIVDEFEQLNMDIGVGDGGDERVEFQLHGLVGPESYKFGYDTGKGENRQFRYEERDGEGKVKGHFGYNNKDGKLQVFNYEADPEHGYHLEEATKY